MNRKGKFVVVDGLDGVGKGVFLDTFVEEAKKDKKFIFDVHEFWKTFDYHPDIANFIVPQFIDSVKPKRVDVIVTSEPTYVGIGKHIREEMISKSGSSTNRRSRNRGCGNSRLGDELTRSPTRMRSRSSVRGALGNGRVRARSFSIIMSAVRSSVGASAL